MPTAVPLLVVRPTNADRSESWEFILQNRLDPYLMELSVQASRFVEAGGRTSDWLRVCLSVRRCILSLLYGERHTVDAYAQSVLLGLGLFLDLITAMVGSFAADAIHPKGRFRLAFEAAPTGLVLISKTGVILFANVQTERMFGYLRQELIGQPIEMLVPMRFRQAHSKHRADFTQTPTSRMMGGAGAELVGLRKDGSEFSVEIGLNPSGDEGSLTVLAVIADISERKRAQEALVSKMWELQRSNEDLEQFAYVASHDLQEPLRMVVSYTTLLSERYRGKLDEKADKFIRYAVEGATRMQQLVADLLAYSRVGSQGRPPKPVSAQAVFDRTLEGMRRIIEESGARIVCAPLPMVEVDDVQLAQLFQNLISNAIKFRGEQPPLVQVAVQSVEGRWLFSIQDNGIGIAQEDHSDRIFQMFQRLNERGKYEGSGIGLTIAKKIVERHRGRIWFESKRGDGTTFFFTLPAATKEMP